MYAKFLSIKIGYAFPGEKGLVTEKDLPNVFRPLNSKVQTQKIRMTQMNPEWLRSSNCMFNSAEETPATGNDQIGRCSICCRLSRGSTTTIVVKNRDEHRATLSLVSLPSRLGDQCHPCRAPILACPRPSLYLFPIYCHLRDYLSNTERHFAHILFRRLSQPKRGREAFTTCAV